MKHTKGKWYISEDRICTDKEVIATLPNQGLSAIQDNSGQIIDQKVIINKANARLIAAAPQLLEACREAETYIKEILLSEKKNYGSNCEYDLQIHNIIKQAIEKAES